MRISDWSSDVCSSDLRSSLTPGSWGGNMDTPEMRAGATCYLGVNVEGALLSFGDGHARQGEGESCGVAVECAMDTTLRVDVVSGVVTHWTRIETDAHGLTTGPAKPLEEIGKRWGRGRGCEN